MTDGPRFVVTYGHAEVITDEAEVAALNRERLSWMWEQMGGDANEDELAARFREEQRVMIALRPDKYLPETFEAPAG